MGLFSNGYRQGYIGISVPEAQKFVEKLPLLTLIAGHGACFRIWG